MSMGGSLMGYENNNDVNQAKCRKGPKALPVVTSVNAAGVTSTGGHHGHPLTGNGGLVAGGNGGARSRGNGKIAYSPAPASSRRSARARARGGRDGCGRGHANGLWSCWYGAIAVAFQAYIAVRCTRRFIAYLSLPWPADAPPPKIELYACLALAGAGVLLLPILLAAACLKLGNLANDGIKLGRQLSTCSRDPPSSLLNSNADSGIATNLWRHGGPTAAFVHLCTAMCFLLPSLLMEARLIHAGFLPKEAIWRTDLDWVVAHRDRLVVLSFLNIPENASLGLGQAGRYGPTRAYLDDGLEELANGSSASGAEGSSPAPPALRPTELSTLPSMPSSSAGGADESPGSTAPGYRTASESTRHQDLARYSDASATGAATTLPGSSSTLAPSARRPTSRMNARNVQRNRPKAKKNWSSQARARPTSSGGSAAAPAGPGNMSAAQSLPLTFDSLADLDRPEQLNSEMDEETDEDYGPITLEYLNYAVALGVYSVRYPAVFWASNKALGTIFSIQLVANTAQSLLAYAGMSVLYKVQVVGPLKALPLLRHRPAPATTSAISNFFGDRFFLLNPHVTLGIFALSSLLVLCSSMVMYLYSYGRFSAFLNQERERRVILSKDSRAVDAGWTYMTHPAALCLFLAIAICSAPLLYDYTVVYRGSLDGAILACIVGTIVHLVIWLVLWVFLTIKQNWTFKVRVTIGRATVRSARSVKLVTDVDLMNGRDDGDGCAAPLLVVGNGRTYTVAENSPKKAIMSVIQKAAMERKARSQGGLDSTDGGDSTGDSDEQIYWLRPKPRSSPVQGGEAGAAVPGQANDKGWLNKKLKQKVTFNDLPSTSGSRNKGKGRRGVADGGPEDDGDYATLRELPLITAHDPADDSTSEENKLLECVNDDQVTYYASGNRDLRPSSEGEPSPLLLSPDGLPDPPAPSSALAADMLLPLPLPPPTPTSACGHPRQEAGLLLAHSAGSQISNGQTPRCLRRADSGMPHDELTPRSDSSHSPPLMLMDAPTAGGSSNGHCGASSTSETSSSGVHSNASNASSQRRATSVEDLPNEPREEPAWRSCSLQRGTQPPTSLLAALGPGGPCKFPPSNPGRVIPNPVAASYAAGGHQYASQAPVYVNGTAELGQGGAAVGVGCPAVILENPNEATVVIRRKAPRPKLQEPPSLGEEPFGRSTNMRMTSFTESNDPRAVQASSATLPHYPTQPVVTYPHCSTMPLPHASSHGAGALAAGTSMSGSSGSCGSVPRHPAGGVISGQQPPPVHGTVPSHTTLPSHHNGVRLMLHGGPNPFLKRFPPLQQQQQQQQALLGAGPHPGPQAWATGILPGQLNQHHQHHTFPQALALNGKLAGPSHHQQSNGGTAVGGHAAAAAAAAAAARHSDRDSANFSMASSGDSDTCLPH